MPNQRVKFMADGVLALLVLLFGLIYFFRFDDRVSKNGNPFYRGAFFNNSKGPMTAPSCEKMDPRVMNVINNDWEFNKIRLGR